jgi:hypothetical protein
VELAGLEPATKRLCLTMDEPASMRESQHLMPTQGLDLGRGHPGDGSGGLHSSLDQG